MRGCACVANVIFAALVVSSFEIRMNRLTNCLLSHTLNFTHFHRLLCFLNLHPLLMPPWRITRVIFISFKRIAKNNTAKTIENRLRCLSSYFLYTVYSWMYLTRKPHFVCNCIYCGVQSMSFSIESAQAANSIHQKWITIIYFAMRSHVVNATMHEMRLCAWHIKYNIPVFNRIEKRCMYESRLFLLQLRKKFMLSSWIKSALNTLLYLFTQTAVFFFSFFYWSWLRFIHLVYDLDVSSSNHLKFVPFYTDFFSRMRTRMSHVIEYKIASLISFAYSIIWTNSIW